MELFARFELAGVITKKKNLTSKTNKDWKGQVLEVSSLGEKLEIFVSEEIWSVVGEGEHLLFKGPLQGADRGVKLSIATIQNVNTKEFVWPRRSSAPSPASVQPGKVA